MSSENSLKDKAKTSEEIQKTLQEKASKATPQTGYGDYTQFLGEKWVKLDDAQKEIDKQESMLKANKINMEAMLKVIENKHKQLDVVRGLVKNLKQKISESPSIRTDLEIEIEVKNARRNWKRCKKKGTKQVTDEDFKRILNTKRVRLEHILQDFAKLEEALKQ